MLSAILPIIYILIFFIIILIFDWLINFFMQNSFFGGIYRFFIAPGIIVHELSHALFVKLTFHKIKKISMFDPQGGYVIYNKTREPISQVLISFAPIIGITLFFLLITFLLQPKLLINVQHIDTHQIMETLRQIDFSRWQTWLHIYLSISLASSLAPSKQDFKVAFLGIVAILSSIYLLGFTSLNHPLSLTINKLSFLAIIIVAFLSLALLISFVFFTITRLAKTR